MRFENAVFGRKGHSAKPFVSFRMYRPNDSDGSLSWTFLDPKRHFAIKAPPEKECGDLNVRTVSGRMDLMDHGANTQLAKDSETCRKQPVNVKADFCAMIAMMTV